jgi:hypothetical protein
VTLHFNRIAREKSLTYISFSKNGVRIITGAGQIPASYRGSNPGFGYQRLKQCGDRISTGHYVEAKPMGRLHHEHSLERRGVWLVLESRLIVSGIVSSTL